MKTLFLSIVPGEGGAGGARGQGGGFRLEAGRLLWKLKLIRGTWG